MAEAEDLAVHSRDRARRARRRNRRRTMATPTAPARLEVRVVEAVLPSPSVRTPIGMKVTSRPTGTFFCRKSMPGLLCPRGAYRAALGCCQGFLILSLSLILRAVAAFAAAASLTGDALAASSIRCLIFSSSSAASSAGASAALLAGRIRVADPPFHSSRLGFQTRWPFSSRAVSFGCFLFGLRLLGRVLEPCTMSMMRLRMALPLVSAFLFSSSFFLGRLASAPRRPCAC